MRLPCGCCNGVSVLTPLDLHNQPGQGFLRYRAGSHSSFMASMIARLSAAEYAEMAGLTTRDLSDPTIAMLDVWAVVADVLTFYQERIANEGYLRTATERLSILELAGLVGYTLKPGVSSSVYLAYLLEKGYQTEIGTGHRTQSLPAPGELPQSFETSEPLKARAEWNAIRPRMTRPQNITWTMEGGLSDDRIFIKGTANNLKAGDCLLLVFGGSPEERIVRVIRDVNIQAKEDRTEVVLMAEVRSGMHMLSADKTVSDPSKASPVTMADVFARLSLLPALQPAGGKALDRNIKEAVSEGSDVIPQTIASLDPVPAQSLYRAFSGVESGATRQLKGIFVMRQKASLFGYNSLGKPPVARFTMNPASGITTGTNVQFTDTSTGNPTTWHWDFGDGKEPSDEQNPTHRFTSQGSYTVTLTVSSALGASISRWTISVATEIL
jgi:hypothetical protein